MKIVEETNNHSELDLINIVDAEYLDNYLIKIKFNNNLQKIVDFGPFLLKSFHPDIKKYLDKELFKKFAIVGGNLNWNDYDMIFPLDDLYNGKI